MKNHRVSFPRFLYKPFFNKIHYTIIVAGRRSGKTYNAVVWIVTELSTQKLSGLWVDTVQNNIDKYIVRYFKPILGDYWEQCDWNGQKKILTFPNGSYLDFGSAQKPENLEGFDYDRSVINEGGIVLKKPGIWHNTLEPMLKSDKNQTKIIGTPKGKNLFHELYQRGRQGQDGFDSHTFTAHESPFWTDTEISSIQSTMPEEVFRQEILAEFIDGAGSVFRSIKQCIKGQLQEPKTGEAYYMAVDLAKHQDFTVITILDSERHLVYFERFNQIDWGLQKSRIKNAWERYHRAYCIIDSTGVGDAIYDDLVNMGMTIRSFKFTNSTKNEIIRNLAVALDNITITFPAITELVAELESFEYEVKPSGAFTYNAPEGLHDDCVISLALAVELFVSGSKGGGLDEDSMILL